MLSLDKLLHRKGLPASEATERALLGAILLDSKVFAEVRPTLRVGDLCLENHQRIYARMHDIDDRSQQIDYITLANELDAHGELKSIGGLEYLTSLTDGVPRLESTTAYARIIKTTAARRRGILQAYTFMGRCLEETDPDKLVSDAERVRDQILDGRRTDVDCLTPAEIIEQYHGGLDGFLEPWKCSPGAKTPWRPLNEKILGFQPGDLIIVAARPSMGKTAQAIQIAEHIARSEGGVLFVSLEMSRVAILQRLVCLVSRVDSHRFRGGYLNEEERRQLRRAVEQVSTLPLFIDDSVGRTVADLRGILRRRQRRHEIKLVIIDYVGLMESGQATQNRNAEVTIISRGLKLMAKEFGIPLLVLSQLSRATEERADKRPRLSDLRDSGSLEQDADLVLFIYRDEMYNDSGASDGEAEIIVAKQRNGPVGTINLVFLERFGAFEEREANGDESEPAFRSNGQSKRAHSRWK